MLIFNVIFPILGNTNSTTKGLVTEQYPLPPPLSIEMVLEESISRRMSVRSFTGESISDEELSTILWAAYGYTENGTRSIYSPDEKYSTIIYVIRSDATYKYIPENHTLSLFKNGNYLYLGQYDSPIKFGLVWDMNIAEDEMRGMSEVGMICQNIYLDANALDLGTVTTGMYVEDLYELGIPSNEKPAIIMPLGHPSSPYDFTYDPLPESNLPSVINNSISLEDSINNRLISNEWDDIPLTIIEQSQLIWGSYGYSYLYDNVNNKRHRTLPSAISIYPYKVFAANHSGVFQYSPSDHSIIEITQGDKREQIRDSIEYNNITITSASWIIIPFLDTNVGQPQYQGFWYYEVGAITHNVILEATALNLGANVIYEILDENGLRSALGIPSQTNLIPLSIIPIGGPIISNPPKKPDISGPSSGSKGEEYSFTASTTDPNGDQVYYLFDWGDDSNTGWLGPYTSGSEINASHIWGELGDYNVKVQAKDVYSSTSEWSDPIIINILENLLEVKLISGGLFKVKSFIKNNDVSDINNIQWSIDIDGGLIILGKRTTGLISIIPSGDETKIVSNMILGFGAINVKITAEMPEVSNMREQSGFVFLLLITINPSG